MSRIGALPSIFFVLMIIPFVSSCKERIIKNELLIKNPTEYIFSVPKNILRDLILSNKYKIRKGYIILDTSSASLGNNQIKGLLKKPGNFSDLFLLPSGFGENSQIYLSSHHDSLEYSAFYYLHFEEINNEKTKISILTFDSKLVAGYQAIPSPPHFVRAAIWVTVEPTTIEEYKLLLRIGNYVHENSMPSLSLPDGHHWNIIKLKRD